LRLRLRIITIAATIWLPLPANGQSAFVGIDGRAHSSAEIDDAITHVMQAAEVPGLAVALINDGKVVYLKAYGVKNVSPREPLTENSVMVAASLTKVAFAYLVMKLVDDHVEEISGESGRTRAGAIR
jgi:CubicO group peptidase (beta-lactamase class C family)